MPIPLTEAALKKRIKAASKADRDDLWKELHDLGMSFALLGGVEQALDLWRFAYSGVVALPDPQDRTIHVCGDGAISAVCSRLGLPDLSKGSPPPKYVPPNAGLRKRVTALDRWARQGLTVDAWSAACDWDNPRPELAATAAYRRARLLAQTPATERDALDLLGQVLEDPSAATLISFHRSQGLLLAVDIAARHKRIDEARHWLEKWYDFGVENKQDGTVEAAFALVPVAGLICDGVLAHKAKLLPQARQLLSQLTDRLDRPEPARAPPRKHTLVVFYGQFYVEPRAADPDVAYFQEEGESDQGFSAFPRQVAIGTPPNTAECVVEMRMGTGLPPLRNAVQVVAVPLSVETEDGLYLRSVCDDGNKRRLDVPAGRYDLVARFFPRRAKKDDDSGLTSWRVVLTFVPAGTVGARCLKVAGGTPPPEVVMHE